jgi:hypothetical protein
LKHGAQGVAITKQDVRGEFRLINHPVVLLLLQRVVQQRIDFPREGFQNPRPFLADEPVGQFLRAFAVVDLQKAIVNPPIANACLVQFVRQPGMAVDANLDGQREPRLQPHVHPSELGIEKIEIQTQAATRRVDQVRKTTRSKQESFPVIKLLYLSRNFCTAFSFVWRLLVTTPL